MSIAEWRGAGQLRWPWLLAGAAIGHELTRRIHGARRGDRPRPEAPPIGSQGRTPKRILVVEDDPSVRRILQIVLELEDYEVTSAADLASARELLRRAPVDLLILDINLPDGTGLELLGFLRDELHRQTPVLVLSGLKQEDSAIHAFHLGADDYVTKPFGPRELQARVRRRMAS